MVSVFSLIGCLYLLYISKFVVSLCKNYLQARKTGLPLIIVPIHPGNLIWLIISNPLRPIIKRYAPYSLYLRIALSIFGWEYHEKRIVFRMLNTDSFMLVTCGKNEFFTINPEAVIDILKRPNEFDKPEAMREVVDIFGPNLLTSVGDNWSKQRKLITSIINERISRVVFEETWRQSRAMVEDIEDEVITSGRAREGEKGERKTNNSTNNGHVYNTTFPSMKRIASNVLSFSAYGMPQDFKAPPQSQDEKAEDKLDMIECINTVIGGIILAALLPSRILSGYPSFLPGAKYMQRLSIAKAEYPGHVKQRLDDERKALKKAGSTNAKSNLTSMLIQASEHGIDENGVDQDMGYASEKKMNQPLSLSEDELQGNLFVFTTAGFETTANALTYALVVLMSEPKWQDWIIEEIDQLFEAEGGNEDPDYVAFYPKALRCLALMMEVLRLYPPIVHIARGTPAHSWVTIRTSQTTYKLPPDSHVYVPFSSAHVDPKFWRNLNLPVSDSKINVGDVTDRPSSPINETIEDVFAMTQDEYAFRPSRWLNQASRQQNDGKGTQQSLFTPARGTYAPFSGGPRICPGQKMAQVEFVCVILALFKDYRIEAAKTPGESDGEMRDRMRGVLKDSHAELTMVMDRLNEVQVRFVRRKRKET